MKKLTLLAIVLFFIACFYRFHDIGKPGISDFDEMIYITAALKDDMMFNYEHPPLAKQMLGSFLSLMYGERGLYEADIARLGPNEYFSLYKPTIQAKVYEMLLASRIFAAILGLYTCFTIYFVTVELFDKRTAKIALFLMLFSIQSVAYSRIFLLDSVLVFFWWLSIYLLLRYFKGNHLLHLAIPLGMALLCKRLLPFLLLGIVVSIIYLYKSRKDAARVILLSLLVFLVGMKFKLSLIISHFMFGALSGGNSAITRLVVLFLKDNPIIIVFGFLGILSLLKMARGYKKTLLLLLLSIHLFVAIYKPFPRFTSITIPLLVILAAHHMGKFREIHILTLIMVSALCLQFAYPEYLMYGGFLEHQNEFEYYDMYVVPEAAAYLNPIIDNDTLIASKTNVNGLLRTGKVITIEKYENFSYDIYSRQELLELGVDYVVTSNDGFGKIANEILAGCPVRKFKRRNVTLMRVYDLKGGCGDELG